MARLGTSNNHLRLKQTNVIRYVEYTFMSKKNKQKRTKKGTKGKSEKVSNRVGKCNIF